MGIREDIDHLEQKVGRLKTDYEQYFAHLIKREPMKLREEVERLILKYSNASITNTSIKFKYNSVVAKYNSYKQYWTRILRAMEEGTYVSRRAEELPFSHTPAAQGPSPATERTSPDAAEPPNGRLAEVYRQYIEAKAKCNEPVNGISFDSFLKSVEKSKRKVEETYKTKDVELKVYIKDGKTKLTITPKVKAQ